jgi:cytochrome P450
MNVDMVKEMIKNSAELPRFPFDRSVTEPPAEYAQFRSHRRLAKVQLWDGAVVWLATHYEDVRAILGDTRFSADASIQGYPALSESRAAYVKTQPPLFVRMDPPDHTRLRRMLTKDFTNAHIQTLRPAIQEIVDRLIDDMLAGPNPTDFFEQFALPLPSIVMTRILGLPYEEHTYFQERSSTKIRLTSSPVDTVQANQELRDYVLAAIKEKEKDPEAHNDLLGRLIIDQIRPGNLSYSEAVGIVELLLQAGHETTANMTTMGLLSLFQNPEVFKTLVETESAPHIRQATEEMLRYHTIVQFVGARVAREDVQIAGETVRAGDGILAMINAANRDPEKFKEPDEFNIYRSMMPPHVAFGFGIHQCLGQPLARLEMEIVFNTLPKRIPKLKLAVPESTLEFKREVLVHGLTSLPVTW